MTEGERQLQDLALSIRKARSRAGCLPKTKKPTRKAEAALLPNFGGEARAGNCLVSVLASGSKGNATFIACGRTKILVDAGISCRRIEQGLKRYHCTPGDLDGIFITHEHSDHINGLPVLLKKADVPVYTTAGTWQAAGRKLAGYENHFVPLTRRVGLKEIQVVPFAISHDAARPVGYTVYFGETKITVATDLGRITPAVTQAAAYADILVLEANHDEEMLRQGPYPYALQQRILGPWGHLSNNTAADFLCRLPVKKQLKVLLAHRSEKNNTPALTLHTMRTRLARSGRAVGEDILLRLACQRGSVRFEKGSF